MTGYLEDITCNYLYDRLWIWCCWFFAEGTFFQPFHWCACVKGNRYAREICIRAKTGVDDMFVLGFEVETSTSKCGFLMTGQ